MLTIRSLFVFVLLMCIASFISAAPRKFFSIQLFWTASILKYVILVHVENRFSRTAPGCFLPVSRGLCRAHLVRYYYDLSSRSCQSFVYSGCGDNANNFHSFNECSITCRNWSEQHLFKFIYSIYAIINKDCLFTNKEYVHFSLKAKTSLLWTKEMPVFEFVDSNRDNEKQQVQN